MVRGATTLWYAERALNGNITALLDSAGAIAEAYSYTVYGTATIRTGAGQDGIWFTADDDTAAVSSVGNPFAFTGRRLDPETGLLYFRMRMYSAVLGSFISRDPEGYVDGMSLYLGYFAPFGVDPMGLLCPLGYLKKAASAIGEALRESAEFAYNGGNIGKGLREADALLKAGIERTDIPLVAGALGAASQLTETAAGMVAPRSHVESAVGFAQDVADIYKQKGNGGLLPAASYAATSWNVGKIYEGVANQDLKSGEAVGDGFERATRIANGTAATAGIAGVGVGLAQKAGIGVPKGSATASAAAKSEVKPATPEKDVTVYRQGTFADESTGWKGNYVKGKQWATDNPLTTDNYAQKYGLPSQNTGKPDWVVGGKVQGPYTARPAPPSHNNPRNTGGATEVLPRNPNNVRLDWFHMPD